MKKKLRTFSKAGQYLFLIAGGALLFLAQLISSFPSTERYFEIVLGIGFIVFLLSPLCAMYVSQTDTGTGDEPE